MASKVTATTQEHLDIESIRDDLVVEKDGRICMVLETSAVNFSLLSEIEQDAKVSAFAGLLNSINFNLQIVVHTENVDVSKYIVMLEKYMKKQASERIRYQIQNYINFIKNLIDRNEVLDKRFYIVLPYIPAGVKRTSPLRQVFGKPNRILQVDKLLERAKADLYPKKDGIIKLLIRMGIRSRQLNTEELIKLYFKLYNTDSGFLPKVNFTEQEFTMPIVSERDANARNAINSMIHSDGPETNKLS